MSFLCGGPEFVDKNPDYTHANDSHRPDKDLLDELKEYADDNDIKLTAVRNNDDLLNAATLLFSSVLAYKVVVNCCDKLSIELTNDGSNGTRSLFN